MVIILFIWKFVVFEVKVNVEMICYILIFKIYLSYISISYYDFMIKYYWFKVLIFFR